MTNDTQPRDHGRYSFKQQGEPELSLAGVHIGEPRPMTREELVLTGQAVDGSPTLSEVTRQVHHQRRQLERAIKDMDRTMLDATVVHAKEMLPGAKELRLRQKSIGDSEGRMTPTFIRTADDNFIGARYDQSENANWASRTIEGADPGSIDDALASISPHSDVWDTDARCDFDPQTDEHIIYLDGRRRHES
jgi:hypothetical protein